jgi:hypothetical protein
MLAPWMRRAPAPKHSRAPTPGVAVRLVGPRSDATDTAVRMLYRRCRRYQRA